MRLYSSYVYWSYVAERKWKARNGSLHSNGQHKYIILNLGGALYVTENNAFQYLS